MNGRLERTRSSMLWAAWADALGFISELTTEDNFRRRTRGRALTQPMSWSRNVGGRMGARVDLPEGCYSDDTQLRLATSRSITSHGFDVEAFSRVELTVWPSYALGGGRASKSAAQAMAKLQANWANNQFKGWESAGGNGAAMRIQPHVYAARQLHDLQYVDDVIRNAVVTHGHPRGIAGAVFHAVSLAFTLDLGRVPNQRDFSSLLYATHESIGAFTRQPELASYWVPQWERATEKSFADAWHGTVAEMEQALTNSYDAFQNMRAKTHDRQLAQQGYEELVQVLRLDDPDVRGSGVLTSVAALLLASAFPDHPIRAAQIAASRLHTDTDTIGTMAAAIVGAAEPKDLVSPVLDQEYLTEEAERLHSLSQGLPTKAFPYPDLLLWQPPKSALDATGFHNDAFTLAGLSALEISGDPIVNRDGVWVWARTAFGQSVLVKHRHILRDLPQVNRPLYGTAICKDTPGNLKSVRSGVNEDSLPKQQEIPLEVGQAVVSAESLFALLDGTGYQDADLGRALKTAADHLPMEELERFTRQLSKRLKTLRTKSTRR